MKAEKTIYKKVPAVHCVKYFFSSIPLIMMLGFGAGFIALPVMAENSETLDIQHVMKPARGGNPSAMADQASNSKNEDAGKPNSGNSQQANSNAATAPHKEMGMGKERCAEANKTKSDGKNKMSESSMSNVSQNAQQVSSSKITTAQNATGDNQNPKLEAVLRPESGKFPEFAQADINADHYVTKEELKNFPYLLQTFDHIDARQRR